MERPIKTLLVVLVAIMSFAAVQAAQADEFFITGEIIAADRYLSTIVIASDKDGESVAIQGFPFHNLELQLDEELDPLDPDADGITIETGDCVAIWYDKNELKSGDVVNKWESLTAYCEECTVTETCFEDEDKMMRKPGRNRPKRPPWAGKGKPPGLRP